MPFPLLLALGVAALPIGAVAIAKANSKEETPFNPDGTLRVTVHPGGYYTKPDPVKILLMASAAYFMAKKLKVI